MGTPHTITITHRGDKAHADCACNWGTDLMDAPTLDRTIMTHFVKVGYVSNAV